MLKTALLPLALLTSTAASADVEIGAHSGINMIKYEGSENTHTGLGKGLRVGYGVALGLVPEVNISALAGRYASTEGTLNITQLQTGLGARFYLGNFFLRPFASSHLTYAPEAKGTFSVGGQDSPEASLPGTGGIGIDFGGGLQLKILDLIYGEAFGSYAREFGDAKMSTIYAGLGVGLKL